MAKLFIGYVYPHAVEHPFSQINLGYSGLAWHTDDSALRAKFEQYGQVEEAVCLAPSRFQ